MIHTITVKPSDALHHKSTISLYYGLAHGDTSHQRLLFRPDTGTAFLASAHLTQEPADGFPLRIVHGDVLRIDDSHQFTVWCPLEWRGLTPHLRRVLD